ncbi:MAG TPA: type III pantothenate kinase [Aeromicrobium sp.]|jgi:type III pantothenate kinase|nr:type III pantothenate kinase [Aeromicrobium sp.]HKY58691.1 type III pantothenate kinase [Aeromicrobium sp.]
MSLLTLDISNSHTTFGIFEGDKLTAHWRVKSDEHRTSDEWYLVLQGLITRTTLATVEAVAVACTVPAILVEIRAMIERYYADAPVAIVGPGVKTGVPIHTDNPREVGADRIVNALAAAELYGGPAIVVDMNGTATIFDVVDETGAYIGGAIAPGVELSLEALSRRGAQLRAVELAKPRGVIGKGTVEAIQSGVVFGFAGGVDGIVRRIIDSLGVDDEDVTVVVTGSYPEAVIDACTTITDRDPFLTLEGLRLVHERNHV